MTQLPTSHEVAGLIQPEAVAAKLASIQNLQIPLIAQQVMDDTRLVEMMWFLQWRSMQPGGVAGFVDELLAAYGCQVGTATMVNARGPEMTLDQKLTIFTKELPDYVAENLHVVKPAYPGYAEDEIEQFNAEEQRKLEAFLEGCDRAVFQKACLQAAHTNLPHYLSNLCKDPSCGFDGELWYFQGIIGSILAMMTLHEKQARSNVAATVVTEKVFDALDYAEAERCMVRIEGDSRFGKTESVKAWCRSRPGATRLVTVPCSNSLIDLLRNIAESLGISFTFRTGQNELKAKVEYILRNGGLFLIMDEAAFLLPQSYSRHTAPIRLNWIRTEIVDRAIPLVLVTTPQFFHASVAKFVRHTGYVMEQFLGRTSLTVSLPSDLSEADLLAVAGIHFPEMSRNHLGYIAAKAMQSENYLQGIEAIAKRTRHNVRRAGRKAITLEDIDQAVRECIPSASAPTARVQSPCKTVESDSRSTDRRPRERAIPQPQTTRRREPQSVPAETFDPCSLRGNTPRILSPEEVTESA